MYIIFNDILQFDRSDFVMGDCLKIHKKPKIKVTERVRKLPQSQEAGAKQRRTNIIKKTLLHINH